MSAPSAGGLKVGIARVVGTPHDEVNAWGMLKLVHGKLVRQTHPDADGTHLREWPIAELDLQTIRDRWGAGAYQIVWFVRDPDNEDASLRFRAAGKGPQFTLDEPEPNRVAAPPAPAPPSGLESVLQIQSFINNQSNSQLQGVVQLAAAIAGKNNGSDMQMLAVLLDKQQAQFQAVITQIAADNQRTVEGMRREIAELREAYEDDDGPDVVDAAARLVPKVKIKPGTPFGDTLKAGIASWFAEDPSLAIKQLVELARAAPGALEKLQSAAEEARRTATLQQQQQQQQRPRAMPVVAAQRPDHPPPFRANAWTEDAASSPPKPVSSGNAE